MFFIFLLTTCSLLRDWSKFKGIAQFKLEDQQSFHLKVVGTPMPNHLCSELARIAEEENEKKAEVEAGKQRVRKA